MSKKPDAYRHLDSSGSPLERVQALHDAVVDDPEYKGWDSSVLKHVRFIEAVPGRTVTEFTIQPFMCNKGGALHGGCAATILDNITSTALVTVAKEGFMDRGHVSRTLSCSYLKAVPMGTKVKVVAEVVSAGKRLAHAKGEIRLLDGTVCVTCAHDKAVLPSSKL